MLVVAVRPRPPCYAASDSTPAVVARKGGRREVGRELSVERIEILDLLLGDGAEDRRGGRER